MNASLSLRRTPVALATVLVALTGCGWLRDVPTDLLWLSPDGQTRQTASNPAEPHSSSDRADSESFAEGGSSTGSIPNQLALTDRQVLATAEVTTGDGRRASVWIRAIAAPGVAAERGNRGATDGASQSGGSPPTTAARRWRYPDLEELLARPAHQLPDLHLALRDGDPIVAVNAAIALSRFGDAAGVDRLADAVRSPRLPLPMRCAAVESLGDLAATTNTEDGFRRAASRAGHPGPIDDDAKACLEDRGVDASIHLQRRVGRSTDCVGASTHPANKPLQTEPSVNTALDQLDRLLDQYGRRRANGRTLYVPELHAELLTALARCRSGANDPRFEQALRSPSSEVRLAALAAFAPTSGGVDPARPEPAMEEDASGELPQSLIDLRAAGDPRIRCAVLDILARRGHPEAAVHLRAALRDYDLQVRLAAIEGLGHVGGEQSRTLLLELLEDDGSHVREAALAALARSDAKDDVLDHADDSSWRVRQAVAEALARWPDRDAAAVAEHLLDDPSSEVHRVLLDSISRWPVELAGPVLLRAMGKRSLLCRRTAADQLAARWPPAVEFPVEGPPARRDEELARLRQQFNRQFDSTDEESAAVADPPVVDVAPAELDRAERWVTEGDWASLTRLGARAVPVLEALALDRRRPLPEPVYRDVLTQLGPAFPMLGRLTDEDVFARRRAADDLAELSAERPLGRLAVDRLASLVIAEDDQLVWMNALRAVAHDAGPSARRLALAALSHPSPEVRRRGCEHFRTNPHPDATEALLRSLADSSDPVVAAAVGALGALGELHDREQLIGLLRRRNESLQLEVAVALIRLDDPRGITALERLTYSRDPDIRREAAHRMGELDNTAFTPSLIRLLDDRVSVARAALAALPTVVGADYSLREDGTTPATSERIRRWQTWWRDHASQ